MPAKFGSILSDLEGLSKQILRVNANGDAFEMSTPPSLPAYTVTNESTDRVIDASDVTLDEVANVLGTLIKDMATIYNGGSNAFQWSTSEQVWPFEKDENGNTLYAKLFTVADLAGSSGIAYIAHGLTGPNYCNRLWATHTGNSNNDFAIDSSNVSAPANAIGIDIYQTNIRAGFITNVGQGAGLLRIYMLYRK